MRPYKLQFLALALFGLLSVSAARGQGFDHAAYTPTSLRDLLEQWNSITKTYSPGYSVKTPPDRIRVSVRAEGVPFKCDAEPLEIMLKTVGMASAVREIPIHHCINIVEIESGRAMKFYIQDVLVPAFAAEGKVGQKVDLYALFVAYAVTGDSSSNQPVLLVSEFNAP